MKSSDGMFIQIIGDFIFNTDDALRLKFEDYCGNK